MMDGSPFPCYQHILLNMCYVQKNKYIYVRLLTYNKFLENRLNCHLHVNFLPACPFQLGAQETPSI